MSLGLIENKFLVIFGLDEVSHFCGLPEASSLV